MAMTNVVNREVVPSCDISRGDSRPSIAIVVYVDTDNVIFEIEKITVRYSSCRSGLGSNNIFSLNKCKKITAKAAEYTKEFCIRGIKGNKRELC